MIKVATCQFAVGADVGANLRQVARQMRLAKARSAHVAHFPEGALSGYVDSDLDSFEGYDWDRLAQAIEQILALAGEIGIWAVIGSAHRLSGSHKPHNSVYVVDDAGELVDRYDKRFCAGNRDERAGELAHYSPGDHASLWEINGVRCGALICHEYRCDSVVRSIGHGANHGRLSLGRTPRLALPRTADDRLRHASNPNELRREALASVRSAVRFAYEVA
ncbi:MAG: carbon-nitrogen hydrolase family protein [Acidimicrobiales bacterium]